jgi:hypothetical protein
MATLPISLTFRSRAQRLAYLVVAATTSTILVGAAACSGPPTGPDAASCPAETPSSCPSPAPRWSTDIQPLIARRCFPCHGPGGIEQPRYDYTTYQGVYVNRLDIQSRVNVCAMPPPDAGAPSAEERHRLLSWIICNAPNN